MTLLPQQWLLMRMMLKMMADILLKLGAGHDLITDVTVDWLDEGNEIPGVRTE